MPLSAIWTRRAANDAASSIYSREPEITPVPPLSILRKGRRPTDSPARHDLPEINLIDHQIALARGTTMALETTREDENRFFRTCLKIFDDLAAVTVEVSDNLILQHGFEPEVSPVGNRRILIGMRKLQVALADSHGKEARAREEWDRRLNLPNIRAPLPQWV
ncbi:hypothetical protein CBS63078_10964 [Aspergillus niger]|nr:hypothetical protein CBS13152_11235 [Aspergillus niger]GLA79013.1 hypothetical protein AtubIFM55763_001426 [Aspergillus tubingensis]KAI2868096.1 hypothetical protein CBS11852_11386 [Aspergillus niger]KAI2886507.1 hypothetical protein CBS63078_10964 [Aspergillus niger]KAI3015337.1 hypothetical protein CBS147347_11253 [Aspergillus niger]